MTPPHRSADVPRHHRAHRRHHRRAGAPSDHHGPRCMKVALSFYSRTMVTGQWACLTTASETLPIKALLSLPCPLLPMTINPAPISSASSTISSSARPSLRYVSLTAPPDSSILLTCCSSTSLAWRLFSLSTSSKWAGEVVAEIGTPAPTVTTCSSESVL